MNEEQWTEALSGNNSFETLLTHALTEAGDDPQRYMKVCKKGMMLALAKDDPERKLLLSHESEKVRGLMLARTAIKSWPLHINRVRRIMNQARVNGGLLPVPLNYHGAHTGRWSGGEKINLQNLTKNGFLAKIRELLVAVLGRKLSIVDLAAIEARVLAWISGQWDLVDKFAGGEEIYCGFATKVLGWRVRKPMKEGKPGYIKLVEDRFTWARNSIGKIGILGCGYGMGTQRIFEYAGGAIDIDTAEKIKDTYRAEHPQIVQFWKDLERAFAYTAEFGRPCEMPRGLKFHQQPDCDVVITLPNGRELHYHKVKLVDTGGSYGKTIEVYNSTTHSWGHIWGGHLAENVVQAMSRDILVEAMLRLEDRGIHTALHIHDELVIDCPAPHAEDILRLAIHELSRPPVWASECPLGAEGVVRERYGGH